MTFAANVFTPANIFFDAACNLAVVGCNPENADIDNPRGDIIREVWFVEAVNAHGDRRLSQSLGQDAAAAAEKLAAALTARAAAGKLPVGFGDWFEGRSVYGSDAYVEYGQADDLALEELEGRY